MATKVYMEALSPTMEEGRLITWLKSEGDAVSEGDVLAEVETDKATMELVARGSGVLRKALIGEGDTASVGTVIAVIAEEGEDISGLVGEAEEVEQGPTSGATTEDMEEAPEGPAAELARSEHTEVDQAERGTPAEPTAERGPTPTPGGETRAGTREGEPSPARGAEGDGRIKASPLARRLAEENEIDLARVEGSGPGGRIVKRDIETAVEQGVPAAPEQAPAAAQAPAAPAAEYEDVPLSQMRKAIARRLGQVMGPVPHFFLTIEVDMGAAMELREKVNERFADEGVKVSPNDLIIKATAAALRRHPWVNAAWTGEGIRKYRSAHIGVAVAIEEGLITPVVRDADRKGITEIAREVKGLAGRAREKKLKPEEYSGSTFSISNLGMFGIEEFTAILNPPEAAILAVGGIKETVVAENGEMVVRPRMRMTMTCDHRVIDGATGAQFLQTLKSYLEEPMLMVA